MTNPLRAYIAENGFILYDYSQGSPGSIQIVPFLESAGFTHEPEVAIGVADVEGGCGQFLAASWDTIDQIIDQIEIAAIRTFGDRPSVPETPNLLT
ncbi:MAG: hypothetical protein H0W28_07480 [Pyrinomonadaceae bacterium]|nr:hypothetical protein [Pyrinomonadaceae bacterium]